MDIHVKTDDLKNGKVVELLVQHRAEMTHYSPAKSIHAFDKSGFYDPAITFWSAWIAGQLAG